MERSDLRQQFDLSDMRANASSKRLPISNNMLDIVGRVTKAVDWMRRDGEVYKD